MTLRALSHSVLEPMCFENAGHLGGDAENDIPKIQRISVILPKFPMYFGEVTKRNSRFITKFNEIKAILEHLICSA